LPIAKKNNKRRKFEIRISKSERRTNDENGAPARRLSAVVAASLRRGAERFILSVMATTARGGATFLTWVRGSRIF